MKKGFTKQDFYKLLKTNKKTGCMEWTKAKDQLGYGFTWFPEEKRIVRTHRLSMILEGHTFAKDEQALHKCDNPSCCNPEHLFIGTDLDNKNDKMRKGRQYRPIGTKNPHSKLTERQVKAIYTMVTTTELPMSKIAKEFNVSRFAVFDIKHGRSWNHITGVKK